MSGSRVVSAGVIDSTNVVDVTSECTGEWGGKAAEEEEEQKGLVPFE